MLHHLSLLPLSIQEFDPVRACATDAFSQDFEPETGRNAERTQGFYDAEIP